MTPAIATSEPNDFRTTLRIGEHALVVDAPQKDGGGDTGPEPHDLLAAALASCTLMTLRMYARRKDWDVSGLSVRVEQSKAADGTTVFTRTINGLSAHDEEQRKRLLVIADKCPVHKMLSGAIRIESSNAKEL